MAKPKVTLEMYDKLGKQIEENIKEDKERLDRIAALESQMEIVSAPKDDVASLDALNNVSAELRRE